jgi:pyruvate formate lyase activating enzyme
MAAIESTADCMTESKTGVVFDIQRAALHDGPGIRTVVFLKGCFLRCEWCHNPESWSLEPQVAAVSDSSGESRTFGRQMTVEDVMRIVLRDRVYYELSGGGLTLSGGEPTLQFDFCRALLAAAREHHLHTCLDTSGHSSQEAFAELLPLVDLFLFDYKLTDPQAHLYWTGAGNELILGNLDFLYRSGARIVLRCPLLPGINDDEEHFQAIAALSRKYPRLCGIEILPYHDTALFKFGLLGMDSPRLPTSVPSEEEQLRYKQCLASLGVQLAN